MQHSGTASRWITRTGLGVALVVVAQLLGKIIPAGAVIAGPFSVTQLVTGSLVNCVLFVFTATTGIWSGVAIGILSSVLATLVGIGPAIPAVTPVIACGNAVLAVVFGLLRSRKWNFARWAVAAVAAAAIKCAFLWICVPAVLGLLSGVAENRLRRSRSCSPGPRASPPS